MASMAASGVLNALLHFLGSGPKQAANAQPLSVRFTVYCVSA